MVGGSTGPDADATGHALLHGLVCGLFHRRHEDIGELAGEQPRPQWHVDDALPEGVLGAHVDPGVPVPEVLRHGVEMLLEDESEVVVVMLELRVDEDQHLPLRAVGDPHHGVGAEHVGVVAVTTPEGHPLAGGVVEGEQLVQCLLLCKRVLPATVAALAVLFAADRASVPILGHGHVLGVEEDGAAILLFEFQCQPLDITGQLLSHQVHRPSCTVEGRRLEALELPSGGGGAVEYGLQFAGRLETAIGAFPLRNACVKNVDATPAALGAGE